MGGTLGTPHSSAPPGRWDVAPDGFLGGASWASAVNEPSRLLAGTHRGGTGRELRPGRGHETPSVAQWHEAEFLGVRGTGRKH